MLKKSAANLAGLGLALFFLFPTYWMITSALKPKGTTITSDYDLVPFSVTFSNFVTAWTKPGFLSALGNSLLVTLTAVVAAIIIGITAAVAMSRFAFRGRKSFVLLMLVAQMAPFEALLIPMFLMMRDLQLYEHLSSLILVYFAVTLPFCAPYLITAAKLALAYAFIGVIGSEFIMARSGMGYEIGYAFLNFDNATMYPLILLILIVSISINLLVGLWEKRLLARRGLR